MEKDKKKKITRPQASKSGKSPADSRRGKAKDVSIIARDRGKVKVEKLPDDHPFVMSILDYYEDEWKRSHTSDKIPREWFYVSDVGRCPRSIYYQFFNAEEKKPMAASTIMMFKFGNLFHEELQRVLRNLGHSSGKFVEFGTWSKVGFMKRGRLDILLSMDGEDENVPVALVVGEIKTKNPYNFDSDPYDNEIDQALSYISDIRGDPYFARKKIADYAYLIFIDRGGVATPSLCVWRVDYSEDRVKIIKREFRKLHKAIKEKTIPTRPYERDSVQCTYCRFQESICWADIPRIEPPALEPDPTIEPPTKEIVDSMANAFVRLKDEIKEKEKDFDLAKKVLTQHFKATPSDEIKVGEATIKYSPSETTGLDVEYLLKYLQKKWHLFAKPQLGLLREAVASGQVDATTFEKAKIPGRSYSITISRPKKKKEKKEV